MLIDSAAGVVRSTIGAVVAFTALIVWICVFQTQWKKWSDSESYMVWVPSNDATGW